MLNEMWRMDLTTHAWEKVNYDESAATTPRGRQGHSMAVYRNQVIVFGGLYEITRELNDFHIFNIEKNEWKRLFRTTNEDDAMSKSDTLKSKKTKRDDSPDATGGSHSKSLQRKQTVKVETKKPKAIKSPRATEEPVNLESPTSVTMKQSFLLKQADKEFEGYFNVVKKKKDGQPACA